MSPANYQIGAINNLVHVALPPGFEITLNDMRTLWSDVRLACAQRRLRHVLVEGEQAERRLGEEEIALHGEMIACGGEPPLRVALCLYDYEVDALTHAFVRRANSGSSSVQVFNELSAALRWLGA